jgi:O-antigen ligase
VPQPIAVNGRFLQQRAPRGGATRAAIRRLAPLLIVFYSFLLFPPEASATLAGIYLPTYRIALLAMTLPAIAMLTRARGMRWGFIDIAVIFMAFWILLSFALIYGLQTGIVRGAGILVDTALPYLVARASVRSFDDLRYFLLLCLPGLVFSAAALALESVSGRLLLRPAFASVFGSGNAYSAGEALGSLSIRSEYRLGLLRAYGPFSHPILGGVMMVSFIPLFYFSGLRSWPFYLGVLASLSGFFSLSSAAFLALMIATAAIGIFHIKPNFPKLSWWLIMSMLALVVWTLHMVSQNGIISVVSRLTLTPHTAGYRTLIWEYGSKTVASNPWFGIGYENWARLSWMGESVDAHFLMLAMRHGFLVPTALLLAILYGMFRLGLLFPRLSASDRKFAVGLNVTMFIFLISAQTVAFFGSSNLYFMTLLAFLAAVTTSIQPRPRQAGQRALHAAPGMYRARGGTTVA